MVEFLACSERVEAAFVCFWIWSVGFGLEDEEVNGIAEFAGEG